MAVAVEQNKLNSAWLRTSANGSVALATLALAGETVSKADIGVLVWSGDWVVKRNTTTLIVLSNNGTMDLASMGYKLTANNDQSIDFVTGTNVGTLIVKVTKVTQ